MKPLPKTKSVRPGLVLLIDSEQADLVRLGAEVMIGALDARIQRADPDRVISSSYKLQRSKLDQLQLQLRPREPTPWQDLAQADRDRVLAMANVLLTTQDAGQAETAWANLVPLIWAIALRLVPPGQ